MKPQQSKRKRGIRIINNQVKYYKKLSKNNPNICPKCGCNIYDPFMGKVKIHDVSKCGGIART